MSDEYWGMMHNLTPANYETNLLVITGTQRSGTSFMASFFRECGADLGTEFWDERVNGGLESPDVCHHYRKTLDDPDFPFRGYWDMIERDEFYPLSFLHTRFRVVKFSYLLSNPVFLKHWLAVRGEFDDQFLIMDRPLEDVIKSRQTKPEFDEEDSELIPKDLYSLRTNWCQCHSMLVKEGLNHFFIPFPHADAELVVGLIRRHTNIPLPTNAEEIYRNLFDPNKVQFK